MHAKLLAFAICVNGVEAKGRQNDLDDGASKNLKQNETGTTVSLQLIHIEDDGNKSS